MNMLEIKFYFIVALTVLTLSACSGGEGDGIVANNAPTSSDEGGASDDLIANNAPTSTAGDDQEINLGQIVFLDGVRSNDQDSDLLIYEWSFISTPGSNIELASKDLVTLSFTPDIAGLYTLELKVFDGELYDTDIVEIQVNTELPISVSGSDQNIALGDTVLLNGINSSNQYGDDLSYQWTILSQPNGSAAILSDEDTVAPSFIPDMNGEYVISLVVNSGSISSMSDEVVVNVKAAQDWLEVKLLIANSGMSGDSCTATGPITLAGYEWMFSGCGIYGEAGWPLSAVIINHNTQRIYTVTKLLGYSCFGYPCNSSYAILSGMGDIREESQALAPGTHLKFNASLGLAHQVVGGWAEFDVDGLGTLQGAFTLEMDSY